MPDLLALLVLALGTYRLARLIGWDTGPAPLVRAREWVTGRGLASDGSTRILRPERPDWIDELLSCPWCLSVWVGLGTAGAWYAAPRATFWVLLPLALSAFVGLVAKRLDP